MKMKKLLKTATFISIVLFSSVCLASPADDYITDNDTKIIELCEFKDEKIAPLRDTLPVSLMAFPSRYTCPLIQFYALRKNVEFQLELDRSSNDWGVFIEIMDKYYYEVFDTYDFMEINLEFEDYLEGENQ
jgi:hypothetical protein